MNCKLAAALATVVMLALPSVAQATPGNGGIPTLILPFSCDGQALTFIVQGGFGDYSAAYVVETGDFFIPTSFTLDGTLLRAKQGPTPQDQVTCTTTRDGGTLSVTGYFVPPAG
jgi:hypothetical protein